MSQGLSGKYALVTGAAGGIGQSLVAKLRAEGVKVAATDISLTGVEAEALLAGDLCDPSFCDRLPQQAQEALGGLDIVINNAGIIRRGKITQASDEDYRLSMAVNVEAPFRLCRAAIPLMAKRGGGAIVNTASCWGLYPGPDHPIYVMSKAAIASLTQCLGRDHASQSISAYAQSFRHMVKAQDPSSIILALIDSGQITNVDSLNLLDH